MIRLLSSDWHCDPWELRPEVKLWIEKGKAQRATLFGVGDLFNILPWGEKRWERQPDGAIYQLKRILDGYPLYYITGNHDPDVPWLEKMFADSPNIRIVPKIHVGGADIRHGHETFIDWRILRHFAPEVVNFASRYFPKQWYDFCRRMGWMPSTFQGTDEYHAVVLGVWQAAFKYSRKYNCKVLRGHTHHCAVLREPDSWVFGDFGSLGSEAGHYLKWGESGALQIKSVWGIP